MILTLGMDHQNLKVYKVYINNDAGLTLQGQIWSKLPIVLQTRSQMSVYMTIGPLVK